MNQRIEEIGFHYLPMQWDEYRKLWRYEEWNRQWAKYRDKDLSKDDKIAIKSSIYSNIDATLYIMEQAVEADPLKYYCPTGDNEKVIKNFAHSLDNLKEGSNIAYVSSFSGNGIGKTRLAEALMMNLVKGVQSPWFDYPIFHNFPLKHKSILYCSESSAMGSDAVIETTLREYLKPTPEREYSIKHSGGNLSSFTMKDGRFTVIGRTFSQSPKKYESENVSIVFCDEPPPDNIWKAIKGRGRDGLIVVLNFTPIHCPAYLMEEIERNVDLGKPEYTKVVSDIWGTTKEKGVRGFRTLVEAEKLVESYSVDERDARASGKPTHYFGKIYKNYDHAIHHVKVNTDNLYDEIGRLNPDSENDFSRYREGNRPWYMPDDRAIYLMADDPADGRPDAICWAAINPNGRYIFMSAYPVETDRYLWEIKGRVNEAALFGDIVQIEQELGILLGFKSGTLPVSRRIIDSRFSTQTRGGSENMITRYRNFNKTLKLSGRWVESYTGGGAGKGEIVYGHGVVRDAFGSYLPDGHPKVVIWDWDKNHHLYTGLDNYVFKQSYKDGVPFGQTIDQKYKDMADAVRFLFCDRSNEDRLKAVHNDVSRLNNIISKKPTNYLSSF